MRKSLSCCLLALGVLALPLLADDEKPKPTPLPFNTDADEDEPHVADGGLTLYYGFSNNGKELVNVAARKAAASPWGKPAAIDAYVTNKGDVRGVSTAGGRYPQYLFFAARDKEGKNYDLYVAVKQGAGKAWTAPTPIFADSINTPADEEYPWVTGDGKALYFSRRTKQGYKLFVSRRTNATGPQGWQEAKEAGLPANFHHATLTPDGRTMYLHGPIGKGRLGLFVSAYNGKGWGKPEPLEGLNDPEGEHGDRSPALSRDGKFLYFASDRPGGKGGWDLYWIETAKLARKK
jgi:hypothetical protein